MLALRITTLEDRPIATVNRRTVTGDRDQLRAAAPPSWEIVDVPDDVPSIDVGEWMAAGNLFWTGEGWAPPVLICEPCRREMVAANEPDPPTRYVTACNRCGYVSGGGEDAVRWPSAAGA